MNKTIRWALRAVMLVALAAAIANPAFATGTRATTNITNQATVNFTDVNGNPLSALSNVVTTTVSQVAGVIVDPDRASNGSPGIVVYYAHVVTNNGNYDDTIDLTTASSNGWTVQIYKDNDNSNTFSAGDTLLTDTDTDGNVDTGLLANDAFVRVIVAVTIPAGTANGTVETTTITGASSFNTGVTESAIDTTTVQAPSLSVVKSVSPAGPQPPNTVLTYTVVVTNNGAGNADNVVLTDPIPANTTYVTGSITYNSAARSDGADGDNADYNVTNPGKVTATIGSLTSGGGTATVTFQVRIN